MPSDEWLIAHIARGPRACVLAAKAVLNQLETIDSELEDGERRIARFKAEMARREMGR